MTLFLRPRCFTHAALCVVGTLTYSIRSGDQNQLFDITSSTGQVKVASALDHDVIPFVLLNIQASTGVRPFGQAQVSTATCLLAQSDTGER